MNHVINLIDYDLIQNYDLLSRAIKYEFCLVKLLSTLRRNVKMVKNVNTKKLLNDISFMRFK